MNVPILFAFIHFAMCHTDRRVITTLKYSKFRVRPTIVNGEPALEGQIPYLVSLKERSGQLGQNFVWINVCGGSIITKLKVLTAAHCFESNLYHQSKNHRKLRVVAGNLRTELIHTGNTETNPSSQWRQIQTLLIHPEYHFPINDLALILVDVPWEFTPKISNIPTARRNIDYPKDCISAGYGKIGRSSVDAISPTLLLAKIDVMTRWQCSVIWELNMNNFVCTSSRVTDVERGDSGGPLTCYGTLDPDEKPGKGLLVGVVSGKSYDRTTLYTRLSHYRDWIESSACSRVNVSLSVLLITELLLIYLEFY